MTTAKHVSTALSIILTAAANGEITPGEAQILTGIVETNNRVVVAEDLERRVKELEKAVTKRQGVR